MSTYELKGYTTRNKTEEKERGQEQLEAGKEGRNKKEWNKMKY